MIAIVALLLHDTVPGKETSTVGSSTTSLVVDDGFRFWDLGTVGMPSAAVGERYLFNFTTIGNLSDDPLTVVRLEFPDLPVGLRVTRVGLRSEAEDLVAGGSTGEAWPSDVLPLPMVLMPVTGEVSNVFEDQRFFSIYVEVELLAEGTWSIGRMDLTYRIGAVEATQAVAADVGDVCTAANPEPCVPGLGR